MPITNRGRLDFLPGTSTDPFPFTIEKGNIYHKANDKNRL